jgi:hypothetical protein
MTDKGAGLHTSRTDALAIAVKGLVGALPLAGPLIAEIIGTIIPNQRIDRIVAFVQALEEKVKQVSAGPLDTRLSNRENADLAEDAIIQASRALTSGRIEQIAHLLATSLQNDSLEHLHKKRLLQILGELNDVEIILLKSMDLRAPDAKEFFARHEAVITGPTAYLGSPPEVIDRAAVHKTYWQHLEQLGLIAPDYGHQRDGEIQKLDRKTGKPWPKTTRITWLGKLLLSFIGAREGQSGA